MAFIISKIGEFFEFIFCQNFDLLSQFALERSLYNPREPPKDKTHGTQQPYKDYESRATQDLGCAVACERQKQAVDSVIARHDIIDKVSALMRALYELG